MINARRCSVGALVTGIAVSLMLGLGGCSKELTGPTPQFSGKPGAKNESNRLVQPPFTCSEQLQKNWIQIRGDKFGPIVADSLEEPNVELPTVTLKRSKKIQKVRDTGKRTKVTFEKDKFDKKHLRWIDQQTLEVLVDGNLNLKPGFYDITVENPSGESVSKKQAFGILPRPQITGVQPELVCDSDETRTINVNGGPFLKDPNGEVSSATIGSQKLEGDAVTANNCKSFDSGPFARWSICEQLQVETSIGDLDPGLHDVKATNLSPAGCESKPGEDEVTFRVLRRPVVENVKPSPVCTKQQGYPVTIEGENFIFDTRKSGENAKPRVTIGGTQMAINSPSDPTNASGNCSEIDDIAGVYNCSSIEVQVEQENLFEGPNTIATHDVVVNNPPKKTACKNNEPGKMMDAPPPQVADATIAESCGDAADRMKIDGKYFFRMGQMPRKPEVDVTGPGGSTVTYSGVDLGGMCKTLPAANTSQNAEHCTTAQFDLKDMTDASGGTYEIAFKNPNSVQCTKTNTVMDVQRQQPMQPVINGIEEDAICTVNEDSLTINGDNFGDDPTVAIDGNKAEMVQTNDAGTKITATWTDSFETSNSPPQLSVKNTGNKCSTSIELTGDNAVDFIEGPIAVYLDPPIHYNGIDIRGTLYFARGPADTEIESNGKVQIRKNMMQGSVRDLEFSNPNDQDGAVQPLLPAEDPNNSGTPLPTGTYDVRLTEKVGDTQCGTWIEDLLDVTDQTDLPVQEISPQYGHTDSTTSVTITADSGFKPTPRVYLSKTSGSSSEAAQLSSVTFNSGTEITGIVPSGLSTGKYEVVVVNPDGSVGILSPPDGFTVTQEPPPLLDNISPGAWSNSDSSQQATVTGQHIRADSNQGSVSVTCESGSSPNPVSITGSSGTTEVTITADPTNLTAGDVCALTITNPNGSKDTIGPIGITEPAYNFVSFEDSSNNLNLARRWPALSSGVPSREQRFLYALGGDDGSTSNVRPGGEFASIDRFGNVQSWNILPYQLPGSGRTLARASRVRDFVYLVGGNDGSTTADIHRANVLDPTHHPDISGLDFNFVPTSEDGLAPGDYFYRIAAVHDSNSDHNPGGETLASDVQPVSVPDLGNRFDVQVVISWQSSLSDVDEFRLYRTKKDDPIGSEQLLETFNPGTNSFTDDGTASFSSDEPLPVGSLGKWDKVGSLNTAREMHAVRGLIHPSNQNRAYIYVLGGRDSSGNRLNSIERIQINDPDPNTPRSQTVDSVQTTGKTLSSTVLQPEALIASPANADNLSSDTAYLYRTGGTTASGPGANGTDTVESFQINADGTLGSRRPHPRMTKSRAGHIGTVANNFAIACSGQNAGPSSSGDNSAEMDGVGSTGQWNSLSGSVDITSRYQAGREAFIGFLYLGGGSDGSSAMNSVEYAVVGSTRK